MNTPKLSLEEYLGLRGLASPISDFMLDKTRLPHGLTERQQKKLERDAVQAMTDYQKRRQEAIRTYHKLILTGEVKDKSKIDKMIIVANGHPDNDSTQAARRRLHKMGIDLIYPTNE